MTGTQNGRWLHRFAVLTALATLALLGLGGLVTSHGAGMSVPDWPNSYGYNMFAFPPSKWVGGIFFEHTHRLMASLVGLLTTVLAVWLWARETAGPTRWLGIISMVFVIVFMGVREMPVYLALASLAPVVIGLGFWRFSRDMRGLRWLGVAALAAVILQGVLGGLRVVWFKDQIGIFHATLAQLFFLLVSAIALFTSRWWRESGVMELSMAGRSCRRFGLALTLLIFCQLVLGATMRHQHAGLSIPDFPLAYGRLWPAMDADSVARYNAQRVETTEINPITAFQIGLQMAHRFMALLILMGVATVAWKARKFSGKANLLRVLAWVWLGLILAQVVLGAFTIWTNKAADVATLHVLVGALSLVTGALWCIIAFRRFAVPVGEKAGNRQFGAPSGAMFATGK